MGFGECGGTIKTRQHKSAANQQITTRQPTKKIPRRGIDNVEEVRLGGLGWSGELNKSLKHRSPPTPSAEAPGGGVG